MKNTGSIEARTNQEDNREYDVTSKKVGIDQKSMAKGTGSLRLYAIKSTSIVMMPST